MLFIFSTPVLIRHLWQHKTVVFLHRCLIHAVLLLWYVLFQQKHCLHDLFVDRVIFKLDYLVWIVMAFPP